MGASRKARFITFEGIEGCGKSTQIRRLARRLKTLGIPFLSTLEPGGTPIGQGIRNILLDARNKDLSPLGELMLYAADRVQHVREVILPALGRGTWVLCDRFSDATEAYQGWARGQDRRLVRRLNELATQGLVPDRTFLLDLAVEKGLARALRRNKAMPNGGQDRFEKEALAFHLAVREAYLHLARRHPQRFVVIDADRGMDEVEESVFQHLTPLILE
ncbi:MAG: dTMP kinase [Thermodesulfobacteriota bacterium]